MQFTVIISHSHAPSVVFWRSSLDKKLSEVGHDFDNRIVVCTIFSSDKNLLDVDIALLAAEGGLTFATAYTKMGLSWCLFSVPFLKTESFPARKVLHHFSLCYTLLKNSWYPKIIAPPLLCQPGKIKATGTLATSIFLRFWISALTVHV